MLRRPKGSEEEEEVKGTGSKIDEEAHREVGITEVSDGGYGDWSEGLAERGYGEEGGEEATDRRGVQGEASAS